MPLMQARSPKLIPPEMLLLAYRSGIFPMAESREDDEIYWMEPKLRAVIPLDGFHCSKSLRKIIEKDHFRVTVDAAFADVLEACAAPRGDSGDTWISERIASSYINLHHQGLAHSIECWLGGELVGGLYGVAFDSVFCGESMFSRADNASKVALAWLVALMRCAGYMLLDCQYMTSHLKSMGSIEIKQKAYLGLLGDAKIAPQMSLPEAYSSVVSEAALFTDGVGAALGAGVEDAAGVTEAAGFPPSPSAFLSGPPFLPSPGKVIMQSLTHTS